MSPASRRHGAAWAAAALAVAAVLLFLAARWVLSPQAFGESGATITAHPTVGSTVYFGMAVYADAGEVPDITMSSAASGPPVQVGGPTQLPEPTVTVDVVDARPNVVENSSAAHLSLLYCVHRTKDLGMGSGMADTLHRVCQSVEPLGSGTRVFNDYRDVILAVTPTRVGTVRVEGVTIDFQEGLRRGSQSIGVTVVADTTK